MDEKKKLWKNPWNESEKKEGLGEPVEWVQDELDEYLDVVRSTRTNFSI